MGNRGEPVATRGDFPKHRVLDKNPFFQRRGEPVENPWIAVENPWKSMGSRAPNHDRSQGTFWPPQSQFK